MDKRASSPGYVREVLYRHRFALNKRLGQNFLTDENILRKIVAAAGLTKDSYVLEIGPGAGALTQLLAERAKRVIAVEIDRRLEAVLAETLADYDNCAIHFGDVLKMDLGSIIAAECPDDAVLTVVANLPYYVTTPILMKLLTGGLPIRTIVVMIQKEVAERLEAKPGTKSYGSLSIAVQYMADPEIVMTVPKTVFIPQPNVDSAVIRIDLRPERKVAVANEAFFFRLVRASFGQRRKTLINNLMNNLYSKQQKTQLLAAIHEAGIDPGRRGETLTIEEFARLSDTLNQTLKK